MNVLLGSQPHLRPEAVSRKLLATSYSYVVARSIEYSQGMIWRGVDLSQQSQRNHEVILYHIISVLVTLLFFLVNVIILMWWWYKQTSQREDTVYENNHTRSISSIYLTNLRQSINSEFTIDTTIRHGIPVEDRWLVRNNRSNTCRVPQILT